MSNSLNSILCGGYSRVQCYLPIALLGDRDPVQTPREMGVVIASENQLAPCTTVWVTAGRERQAAKEGPLENPGNELPPRGLITPTKYIDRQKCKLRL